MARQYRVRLVKPKVQLALVVDQLEELFVGGFSAELQQKYLATLGALVRCQRVFVIAILREDFYATVNAEPLPLLEHTLWELYQNNKHQKNLEVVTSQRDGFQGQLKDSEAKLQQAQKSKGLGSAEATAVTRVYSNSGKR